MVTRSFQVRHNDSDFAVVYDTDDGLEVLKYQLFSLTSVPPDEQKIISADDDRVVSDDSDLAVVSENLRLVSMSDEQPEPAAGNDELLKSDEELARMLQAEEEALMYQQFAVREDNGAFEGRVRPCVSQVLMYEDPIRQEAARKTVSVEQL